MKRDWEIIREILLKLEAEPTANVQIGPDDIAEHQP